MPRWGPGPTRRQLEVLEWIKAFIRERGVPPTLREIAAGLGVASNSIFEIIQKLEGHGCLRRGDWGSRSIILEGADTSPQAVIRCVELPILAAIPAGQPIEAIEDNCGTIPVNRELLRGARGFALKVNGRSMVEAGIFDGDYVIVRQQETARNGDIVVALIENEATLKRFFSERNGVRLEPANRRMRPIHVRRGEFKIQGKVVGLVRIFNGGTSDALNEGIRDNGKEGKRCRRKPARFAR